MSPESTFTESASYKTTLRRPAPFSVRLNPEERRRLEAEANGVRLGTYLKAKILGDVAHTRAVKVEERKPLAQALALLGQSRIPNNINQLAYLANIGALPLTPETIADINEACAIIKEIKALLLEAVGKKAEQKP
jgi:hypothetical protein